MEIVLCSHEMRACDRYAIDRLGIPSLVLMENAGRGVVDAIEDRFGPVTGRSFLVVCGKGNNGGDGFVAARHLANRGAMVVVALAGNPSELRDDARVNFSILRSIASLPLSPKAISIKRIRSLRDFRGLGRSEFVVDALVGTGFSGKPKRLIADCIGWINASDSRRISIDVPSGLNADTGRVEADAVRAELTVTMAFKKTGLLVGSAGSHVGEISVADIGMPSHLPRQLRATRTWRIESRDVSVMLPIRPFNAHKHSVGKILVLAGSPGLTGAAALSSLSAMRVGAGAVVLATPASVYPVLGRKLTEVMVDPIPDTPAGTLSLRGLESIRKHLEWSDICLMGPGLSRDPETKELILSLLERDDKPMVVDADGLNAVSEDLRVLRKRSKFPTVLTPHSGEFSRLTGIPASDIDANRIETAREFASRYRVTLVLKGAPTVTAGEDKSVVINSTGNEGMATAGAGDVLAGCIVGLWSQHMKADQAAVAGAYVHGLAGDLAADQMGKRGVVATDIQSMLPRAISVLEGTTSLAT